MALTDAGFLTELSTPNQIVDTYTPRGSCIELLNCRDPEVLMSGPAGTGKTRACLTKLHLMCMRNPGMRALLVRKTEVSLSSSVLPTYREHVAAAALYSGYVRYFGGSAAEPAQYKYWNGSCIILGGMDKATRVLSTEYDIIYVPEAIELTITDWETLTGRLRHGTTTFQQLIADTNPDVPTHWLKKRCDDGTTKMIWCKHEDNPRYYDSDGNPTQEGVAYLARLDGMTGVRKMRYRDGLWVAAEGLIYDDFDPAVHIIDRFDIPDTWPRYWSVDFGTVNPFVCQWWAVRPTDGALILYREYVQTGLVTNDHARNILGHCTTGNRVWTEPKPQSVITDHDAQSRSVFTAITGLSTKLADKEVLAGIDAMGERLKAKRLLIMRDSLTHRDPGMVANMTPIGLEQEIPGYIWAKSPDGKPLKEQPVKLNDHSCDAARYLVKDRDRGRRPNIRVA